jgi:serine protease
MSGIRYLFLFLVFVAPQSIAQEIRNISPGIIAAMLERPASVRVVPGEVIVKYRQGRSPMSAAAAAAMNFSDDTRRTSGGEVIYKLSDAQLSARSVQDIQAMTISSAQAIAALSDVEYAQPNYIVQIVRTPDDPLYSLQWHYFNNGGSASQSPGGVNLPTTWDVNRGDPGIVLAVIDTGILPNHADIAGSTNLLPGFDMISNAFTANDGDGRDPDPTDTGDATAAGECFPGSPPQASSWHGTHVAGTTGVGRTNNGVGVAGVNWRVSLQAIRVLGKCGGTIADINDAIRWAAGLTVPGIAGNPTPARVINMSLGGFGACTNSPATQSAIDDAVAAGTSVVVAAGNNAQDAANFNPASCEDVITVAASDARGHLVTRYSNFGASVEIMAPGGDVQRDDNGDGNPDGVLSMVEGGYAFYNGTSMASPHVAGVAALLLARQPTLTPAQVSHALQSGAMPRSAAQCPRACGAGLLNATVAVAGAAPAPRTTLAPALVSLTVGASDVVLATVTQSGAPVPGTRVDFVSDDVTIATISPSSAQTDVSGTAQASVSGIAAGATVVRVSAAGATGTSTVQVNEPPSVPDLGGWAMLALVLGILILVAVGARTRPSHRR